jgi:hypothetical protein
MLTQEQRQRLKAVASGRDWTQVSEDESVEIALKIDEVVAQLKLESPECFKEVDKRRS